MGGEALARAYWLVMFAAAALAALSAVIAALTIEPLRDREEATTGGQPD